MYVLPRQPFAAEPDQVWSGKKCQVNQWASTSAVRPLASLSVVPADFSFLDKVNGHQQPTVAKRAAMDPDAFPWRD